MTIEKAEKHHLSGILALQKANLKASLSPSMREIQGFVSVEHDLQLLQEMNEALPHIVAEDKSRIVGYALSMMPSFS